MSEERRKRQQERVESESNAEKKKRVLMYAGILVLLAAAFLAGRYYRNHKYDSFAKCLASKQAKMYGLYWCPHCADQKHMFGDAFQYVPYVECAVGAPGSGKITPECQAAGVKLFPSWQFGAAPPKEGVLSLEDLSARTGCSLP
jgi:hypothetical protein